MVGWQDGLAIGKTPIWDWKDKICRLGDWGIPKAPRTTSGGKERASWGFECSIGSGTPDISLMLFQRHFFQEHFFSITNISIIGHYYHVFAKRMVGTISSLAASRMTISHTPNHVIARRMVGTISSLAASRMTISDKPNQLFRRLPPPLRGPKSPSPRFRSSPTAIMAISTITPATRPIILISERIT